MIYHFTLSRIVIIKNMDNNKYWWGCIEMETLINYWWEYKMVSHFRKVWQFLKMLKIELPYDPVIPPLDISAIPWLIRNIYLAIQMANIFFSYIFVFVHSSWLTVPQILCISWVIRKMELAFLEYLYFVLVSVPEMASECLVICNKALSTTLGLC